MQYLTPEYGHAYEIYKDHLREVERERLADIAAPRRPGLLARLRGLLSRGQTRSESTRPVLDAH